MELRVEDNGVVCSFNLFLQLSLLILKVLLLRTCRAQHPVVSSNSSLQPLRFFEHSSLNLNPSERQPLSGQRPRTRRIVSAPLGLPRTINLG